MASRTLLVDPTDAQKNSYSICNKALDEVINSLEIGKPISYAYRAGVNYIKSKNPELAQKIGKHFGFGIGSNVKEDHLMINESNQVIVRANMIFHVRIVASGIEKETSKSVIALGETVVISPTDAKVILTAEISRNYDEISY